MATDCASIAGLEASKHTALTRAAHGLLAIAVIVQLTSSQVMIPEEPGKVANSAFEVHQYAGLAAFAFVLLFWGAITVRRHGTEASVLFPWFSATQRSALWTDTREHVSSLWRFKLPPYHPKSPFSGAIHGLGLIIITLMATSGTLYYFVNDGDPDGGGLVAVAMAVHRAIANLAWAYLIAHAAIAVIYHFATDMSLREMWSVDGHSHRKD